MSLALLFSALATVALALAQCPSGCSHSHLVYGSPESVGLLRKPLELAVANITKYIIPANYSEYSYDEVHPIEPGVGTSYFKC